MKIKKQTRKLAAGCSKQCFEVVDRTDEVSNHIYGKATLTWFEEIFEEYEISFLRLRPVKRIAIKERPTNSIQVNCIFHTATSEKQAVPTGMDKVNKRPKKLLVRARTSGARFFRSMALIFG